VKKNDRIQLRITDIGTNGEGIGRYEGYAFFVKDAFPGDEVLAVITKMNKGFGYARALEIVHPSPDRIDPPCPNASRCGGCQIMQLDYRKQLEYKENKVISNLKRIGGLDDPQVRPIMGMDIGETGIPGGARVPLHFRNKMQFPVGMDPQGHVITGFYAGRTHYIVAAESCPVSAEAADGIMAFMRQFIEAEGLSVYDEKTGQGLVRHILIRTGTYTGQIMVCIVINGDTLGSSGQQERLVSRLTGAFPQVADICLNINKKNTNVILGEKVVTLYGPGYIEDMIGDLTFRISPLSFFQVNPVQTRKLYGKALEYAALTGSETVWDLYCGTGTISLFLARQAKKVCGVEIIPAAIENAKENAALNGIDNTEFFCGASEELFPEMTEGREGPDVVVVDPPRKGCGRELLDAILRTEPDRIVYVSCDSATLARDIKILSEKYRLVEATPCDMFPNSVHIEVVSLLQRMSNTHGKKSQVILDVEMEDYYRIKGEAL